MQLLVPQTQNRSHNKKMMSDRSMLISDCLPVNPSNIFSDINVVRQRDTLKNYRTEKKKASLQQSQRKNCSKRKNVVKKYEPQQIKQNLFKENKFLLSDNLSLYTTKKKSKKTITSKQLSLQLAELKQLWQKQPIFEQIKNIIWNLKPPLPAEEQRAIIQYCSTDESYKKYNPGTIMDSARIFKNLSHIANHYSSLEQLSEYKFRYINSVQQSNEKKQEYKDCQISEIQETVLKYNLLYLYFSFGLKKQFIHFLKRVKDYITDDNINKDINIMYAKLVLSSTQESQQCADKSIKNILQRHKKITHILTYKKQIQETQSCNIYEAFNIGLTYYKAARYLTALKIFEEILKIFYVGRTSKLYFCIQINMARCLFGAKKIEKAIKILKKLLTEGIKEISPYEREIKSKIFCWKKFSQLEQATKSQKKPQPPAGICSDRTKTSYKQFFIKTSSTSHTCRKQKYQPEIISLLQHENKQVSMLSEKEKELHNLLNKNKNKGRKSPCLFSEFDKVQKKYYTAKKINRINRSTKCFRYPALKSRVNQRQKLSNRKSNTVTYNMSNSNNKSFQDSNNFQRTPIIRLNHCQSNINFQVQNIQKTGIITTSDLQNLTNVYYNSKSSRFKNSNYLKNSRSSSQSSGSSSPSILSFNSNQSLFSNIYSESRIGVNLKTITKASSFKKIDGFDDINEIQEGSVNKLIAKYMHLIKSTQKKSERAQHYYKLGELYMKINSHEHAFNIFKNSFECGYWQAGLKIGDIHYQRGSYRQCIEHYEKYLDKIKDKNDHETKIKLLHSYCKISEFNFKAIESLKQMLDHDPSDLKAHVLLVSLYYKQKNFLKAIDLCVSYREHYWLNIDNHHMLGLLYKSMKYKKQAYQSFMTCLRLKPNQLKSLIEMADLVESPNFYSELLQIYCKTLPNKDYIIEIMQILKILIQKKSLKGINIRQKLSFPQIIIHGDFFIDCQMFQQAQLCYLQAQKLSSNLLIKQKLGNVAFYRGQYAKALKLYKQSQLRKPIPSIQLKIAVIKLKEQQYEESRALFKKWIEQDLPNRGGNIHLLGICQYNLGRVIQALALFKKSLGYGYDEEENSTWIGKCLQKLRRQNTSRQNRKREQEESIKNQNKLPFMKFTEQQYVCGISKQKQEKQNE